MKRTVKEKRLVERNLLSILIGDWTYLRNRQILADTSLGKTPGIEIPLDDDRAREYRADASQALLGIEKALSDTLERLAGLGEDWRLEEEGF